MENQSYDYSSVIDTITNMFGDVITRDVVYAVVENYDGDLNLSVEAIMNITSDTKNVTQSEEEIPNSIETNATNMLSTTKNNHIVKAGSLNLVSSPSTSYASASQSKGAIPKQTGKPKTVTTRPVFWTDQIRQIMTYHNQGARVLIMLRGAPGSGKTYLAKQIIEMIIGSTYNDFRTHICSTDDYFMNRGQYLFDKYRLTEAHTWNQNRVRQALVNGLSPIIVDNTNIELWEMEPYVRDGVNNGYYIEVLEPYTQWAKKAYLLSKRNVHNVPISTIKRMLDNYQEILSGLYLTQAYGLSYPGSMVPPVLRKIPPVAPEENAECGSEEKKEIIFQRDSSSTDSQEECSSVLQIQETYATEGLTEAVPEHEDSKHSLCGLEQNMMHENSDVETKTEKSSSEELSNKDILKQKLVIEAQTRLDEIEQVEAEWENGEIWESESKKNVTLSNATASPLNAAPKPRRKQDTAETVISSNIMDSVNKCDDWSQISMFMPPWHDAPQPSVSGSSVKNEDANVEKLSSSTCVEIGDTDVENNKNNFKIITATPKDINMFHVSSNTEKIPDKRKLDKSTLTYERTISEAYRCKNEEQHFIAFRRMFKNVARPDLRDIFDKCRGDVNWAVNIVLDSMTNKLLEIVESEESSDIGEEIIEQCDCLAAYNIIPDGAPPNTQESANKNCIQENASDNGSQIQKINKKDIVLSESSMQLKRQIEQNVVISENHYSPYCLKLRKMRHGEIVGTEDSSEQQLNLDGQEAAAFVGSSAATTASIDDSDDEDESNAECIDEPGKVVNVNVGMEFITMLDKMFGRKDIIYPDNITPTLSISVSILNELNASWMEALMHQFDNENKQMQEIIKQDEEFARELALKEAELLNAGKEPEVPDFKEIMDMDFALSLYQKDLAEWRNSEPQDLAAKLTRDKLYNLFPEVSQDVLAELLMAHDNNFQATVESLLASTGRQDILEKENGINKFVMEKEMQRQAKILEQERKALSEEEWPLLPKGETATMATVNGYRGEGELHLQRRNMNYQKAQEFIGRGMTQVANHYSSIASYHKQRYEQANSLAAAALIQFHANNNPDSCTIDLHYMRVAEARESLDIFLDTHIRKLKDGENRGNSRYINLFLITGRGLHSPGQPRIKPMVKKRLRERGLSFSERNPGLLTARVCAEDKLSYQIPSA